jgi:hypothetical protein
MGCIMHEACPPTASSALHLKSLNSFFEVAREQQQGSLKKT